MKNHLPALFLIALVGPSAHAIEPASGELSLEHRLVEFSGGPNPAVFPLGLGGSEHCPPTAVPVCEEFFVTTDLPANLLARHPDAALVWTVGWPATGPDDYDLYVYDELGYEVDQSATGSNPEDMSFAAEPGVHTYRLVIAPFIVLTSPYQGRVELVTGARTAGK
jgi:hypothetical protein